MLEQYPHPLFIRPCFPNYWLHSDVIQGHLNISRVQNGTPCWTQYQSTEILSAHYVWNFAIFAIGCFFGGLWDCHFGMQLLHVKFCLRCKFDSNLNWKFWLKFFFNCRRGIHFHSCLKFWFAVKKVRKCNMLWRNVFWRHQVGGT